MIGFNLLLIELVSAIILSVHLLNSISPYRGMSSRETISALNNQRGKTAEIGTLNHCVDIEKEVHVAASFLSRRIQSQQEV